MLSGSFMQERSLPAWLQVTSRCQARSFKSTSGALSHPTPHISQAILLFTCLFGSQSWQQVSRCLFWVMVTVQIGQHSMQFGDHDGVISEVPETWRTCISREKISGSCGARRASRMLSCSNRWFCSWCMYDKSCNALIPLFRLQRCRH